AASAPVLRAARPALAGSGVVRCVHTAPGERQPPPAPPASRKFRLAPCGVAAGGCTLAIADPKRSLDTCLARSRALRLAVCSRVLALGCRDVAHRFTAALAL